MIETVFKMENNVEGMLGITMDKIKQMIDVDTIIGEPINAKNGSMILPVSKVSYGFASGGSDFNPDKGGKNLFGGGSGAGITITPIAFLVITETDVKLLQIESFTGALDRIISMAPDLISKISRCFKEKKENKGNKGNKEDEYKKNSINELKD